MRSARIAGLFAILFFTGCILDTPQPDIHDSREPQSAHVTPLSSLDGTEVQHCRDQNQQQCTTVKVEETPSFDLTVPGYELDFVGPTKRICVLPEGTSEISKCGTSPVSVRDNPDAEPQDFDFVIMGLPPIDNFDAGSACIRLNNPASACD